MKFGHKRPASDDHRDNERIVELTRLPTRFAADVAVAALEARGITASALHSDAGGWAPNLSTSAGHRVMVFDTDIDVARELLVGEGIIPEDTSGAAILAVSDPAKYAQPERERRFVLSEVPGGATNPREILDLYLAGTRVRVRSVRSGDTTVYKLGQKIRPTTDDPRLVMHTTMYLSQSEYEVFSALAGNRLHKTRFALNGIALNGMAMSVDAFHDELEGLVLAEVDFGADTDAVTEFEPPDSCIAEVTRDERFTGGQLAASDRSTIDQALQAVSDLRLPKDPT